MFPFIFVRLPTRLCYFQNWYYLKIVKDLYLEFPKKFNMYGYFINTSVAFPFSHQKSIIKSNFFDPLYFIIRHKKVNENLKLSLNSRYQGFIILSLHAIDSLTLQNRYQSLDSFSDFESLRRKCVIQLFWKIDKLTVNVIRSWLNNIQFKRLILNV